MMDPSPLLKDIQKRKPNLDKAERILGYRPKVSFEDGLIKTVSTIKSMQELL